MFTVNNSVTAGSSDKGSGDNLSKIPALAGVGFGIPVPLPRALTTTLFLYEMCHLHILMCRKQAINVIALTVVGVFCAAEKRLYALQKRVFKRFYGAWGR